MKPLDSRAERSRTVLLRAFVELIFRDGFENISVRAITTRAETARSTFYEHFSSKEDILRASMSPFFGVLASCVNTTEEPPELTRVLTHFWENRRLTDATFSGQARIILARALGDMIEAALQERFRESALALPSRLASIQLAEAQLALVEAWLRGRAYCSPGKMATALYHTSSASAAALEMQENGASRDGW